MNKEQEKKLGLLTKIRAMESTISNKPMKPMSCEEIANRIGVETEEIEQIEKSALAKLAKFGITESDLRNLGKINNK